MEKIKFVSCMTALMLLSACSDGGVSGASGNCNDSKILGELKTLYTDAVAEQMLKDSVSAAGAALVNLNDYKKQLKEMGIFEKTVFNPEFKNIKISGANCLLEVTDSDYTVKIKYNTNPVKITSVKLPE